MSRLTRVLHPPGFPGRDRPRRETHLVAAGEPLIHVVVDLAGTLKGRQHALIPPRLDSEIHSVNTDRQFIAVADENRHIPEGRILIHRLRRAGPYADPAHLRPQPILAQPSQLDESERKGQAGENRPDRRNGHPPDHRTTVAEVTLPRPIRRGAA
jgi:hypothetical protein